MTLRGFAPTAVVALAIVAAACGGSSDDDRIILTPLSAEIQPVVVSSDLAVGANRMVLGLLDQDGGQVLGADLHLRFFLFEGSEGSLKFELDAESLRITKTYTHTHDDGTTETHEAGETGVYVAQVDFDAAGQWGVEVTGTAAGRQLEAVRPVFSVNEDSFSPNTGDPAPASVQTILSDVTDITEIDTSEVPIPEMHDKTIADALSSGRPTVIVFATPSFCLSQICGPTKQIVDELYEAYKSQANFIHVEPYDIEKARAGIALEPLPFITDEWRLQNEPWVFVVDGDGIIAAKFEGVVSYEELEGALSPLLNGGGSGGY